MPEEQLTLSESIKLVRGWESLSLGFPKTPEGITALAKAFIDIAGTKEKGEWLSQKVIHGCSKCPTPIELRRIFSSKYPPADGKSVNDWDASDFMFGGGKRGE